MIKFNLDSKTVHTGSGADPASNWGGELNFKGEYEKLDHSLMVYNINARNECSYKYSVLLSTQYVY